VSRAPAWISPADLDELKRLADDLGFLLDDMNHLYERAKLLQEELAARLAEQTGKRVYLLSVLSAVLLPMTLVTGVFGMNVAGLPGLEGKDSFWWTMLLVVSAGPFMLALLRWRRLL
jgi:zinc transporter